MSEQVALKIKHFLKDNVVGFVFIIIIAFFGLSVWTNTNSTNEQVGNLIYFTDNSLPVIRVKFQDIAKRSVFESHTAAQYDDVISQFQEIRSELTSFSTKIPTQSNDPISDNLENTLRLFFSATRLETVDGQIELLKARKNLVDDYNNVARLKVVAQTGNATELNLVIKSAKKVYDFELATATVIRDEKQRKAKIDSLNEDIDKISTIQGLLNRVADDANLTDEMRNKIIALYVKSGWPLEISISPAIKATDLETTEFISNVLSLQKEVSKLSKKYPDAKIQPLTETLK